MRCFRSLFKQVLTHKRLFLTLYINVMFAPSEGVLKSKKWLECKVSLNQQLESGIMQDRSISENCTILNLAFEMRLKILCVSLIKNGNDGHISIVTLGSFGWWHWVKIPSERIQRPNLTVKFKIWRFSFRPSWDLYSRLGMAIVFQNFRWKPGKN